MIESNVIYDFEDFRTMVSSKDKIGAFYLIYDDFYFEEIDKTSNVTRDAIVVANNFSKTFNVVKYLIFNTKANQTTKDISNLLKELRKHHTMLTTIYNPKIRECFLLFISNTEDEMIEKDTRKFIENGEMHYATTSQNNNH